MMAAQVWRRRSTPVLVCVAVKENEIVLQFNALNCIVELNVVELNIFSKNVERYSTEKTIHMACHSTGPSEPLIVPIQG